MFLLGQRRIVASYEGLQEAYEILKANIMGVARMIDHVSQHSIYFRDPDRNGLEIYYEYRTALELFLKGRGDEDFPFTFDDRSLNGRWLRGSKSHQVVKAGFKPAFTTAR